VISRVKSIIFIIINLDLERHVRSKLLRSGMGQTHVLWVLQIYLAKDNWVKSKILGLWVCVRTQYYWILHPHPTLMRSDCNQTQDLWVRHLREVQSSWAWCCSQTHLNLDRFIVIINIIICIINHFNINIKNIIIRIRNIFIFMMINIICIRNIFIFIIINIINIIIKKF